MKNQRNVLWLMTVCALVLSGCLSSGKNEAQNQVPINEYGSANNTSTTTSTPSTADTPVSTDDEEGIPQVSVVNIPVGFASQAPFGVWDDLHDEACEEASLIMAVKHFNGEPISPHSMEQAILSLVEWEEENGYEHDMTAAESAEVVKSYFNMNAAVSEEVTVDRIKRELAAGNLIVVPAAGRALGNPNFTGEGPIYHMLLIRGYDDKAKQFITNDPGTRNGNGYRYRYQTLLNAIHDWDHGFDKKTMQASAMLQTPKRMVIITPKS